MAPTGFEPAIPASEQQQAHTLDCAATGIGTWYTPPNQKTRISFVLYKNVQDRSIQEFVAVILRSKYRRFEVS
jgi:hypothetical protein